MELLPSLFDNTQQPNGIPIYLFHQHVWPAGEEGPAVARFSKRRQLASAG